MLRRQCLGESLPESDVDLLVDFNRPITLFDLVAVQQYLEACLMPPRKLEDELEKYGCKLGPTDFRETLEEQQVIFSPHWKIDELLCNPDEAKRYCVQVRLKVLGAHGPGG